jgi:paraquat-inducible protein B
MQTDQFFASLDTQVKQFNATQSNSMAQFNVSQENALSQFNASQQNARDQFNAQNRLVIDQSNAEWRRNIATADTAAINRANEVNASNSLQVTLAEYNNLWQSYRDMMQYSFTSAENDLNRENALAIAVMQKDASIKAAELALKGKMYEALGSASASVLKGVDVVDSLANMGTSIAKAGAAFADLFSSGENTSIEGTGYTELTDPRNPIYNVYEEQSLL